MAEETPEDGGTMAADHAQRPDDTVRIVMVANAALVGVPAAYATSDSVWITVLSAAVALGMVATYICAQRSSTRRFTAGEKR